MATPLACCGRACRPCHHRPACRSENEYIPTNAGCPSFGLSLARCGRPLEVRQNFVNQPLTFTVRVTCVDDLARLLDQPTDDRELLPGLGTRAQRPLHRDDRKVLGMPWFLAGAVDGRYVSRQISVRVGRLQQVPEAPGDTGCAAIDIALTSSRHAQLSRDGFRNGRFLSNEQTHSTLPSMGLAPIRTYQMNNGVMTARTWARSRGPK